MCVRQVKAQCATALSALSSTPSSQAKVMLGVRRLRAIRLTSARQQVLEDGALGILIAMTNTALFMAEVPPAHDKPATELPTGVLPTPAVNVVSLSPAPATDETCFAVFTESTAAEYAILVAAAQARRALEMEARARTAAPVLLDYATRLVRASPVDDDAADKHVLEARARATAELSSDMAASRVALALESSRADGVLQGLRLCPEAIQGPKWSKEDCREVAQGTRLHERPPRYASL